MGRLKFNSYQTEAMRTLRDQSGMSYASIGKVFGCTGETVKTYLFPDYRAKKYALRNARKKGLPIPAEQKENALRQVTLAEVAQKAAKGKKIHGEIRNATIDDLAMLNDMFNVSFTVYFD